MRTLLIASAVLLTAFAPAPLPRREKGKDHLSQLTGNWEITTIKWRGSDSYSAAVFGPIVVNKSDVVVLTRGRLTVERSGAPAQNGTFAIQLSGHGAVRNIDLSGANQTTTVLGLYELRGGALYLSIGISGDRPNSLTGDGNEIGFVLKRR